MNAVKAWDKARKENLQRERADEAVRGTIHFLLVLIMLAVLADCGGSSGQPGTPVGQAAIQKVNWTVVTDASNSLERTRAWEICGGAVLCSDWSGTPFSESGPVGFIGSATESQASCYKLYSNSYSLATTTQECGQHFEIVSAK